MLNHAAVPSYLLRIGIALVAALLLFARPAASEDNPASSAAGENAPTGAECESQWASSAADDTCRNESVTAEDGMCRVEAECLATLTVSLGDDSSPLGDVYYSTELLVSLDQVARLSNCGGVLEVGSC